MKAAWSILLLFSISFPLQSQEIPSEDQHFPLQTEEIPLKSTDIPLQSPMQEKIPIDSPVQSLNLPYLKTIDHHGDTREPDFSNRTIEVVNMTDAEVMFNVQPWTGYSCFGTKILQPGERMEYKPGGLCANWCLEVTARTRSGGNRCFSGQSFAQKNVVFIAGASKGNPGDIVCTSLFYGGVLPTCRT